MRLNWSLQARFLLATSVLTLVLCTAFAFAVHQFIELLEDELLHHTLVREMQELKQAVGADPRARAPTASGLGGFIVRTPTEQAALPPELRNLSTGTHEDVSLRGRTFYVAVDHLGNTGLYILLDTEHVDAIERNVATVSVLIGLIALGLAAIIGVALARAVLRPVTLLASDVARLDPTQRGERLENRCANREVGIIAAALDDYMRRLDGVLEREQAFTEDASHELRTPLAIIGSATELLLEEPELSAPARERLLRIRRATGQMQSLIEALLFLARGEPTGRPQFCSLDQIVREAVEAISSSAAAKSLQITLHVEPVLVNGGAVMVACVVNNLLLNAANFTQNGTIDVRLTRGELVVQDTGIGIPPEDLSRIFERRYRGSQSRGLGLGLYLVSRICQRLGWKIETRSAPGVGTTFRIELPPVSLPESAAVASGVGVGLPLLEERPSSQKG
jgi:signal transduction histidine kinase